MALPLCQTKDVMCTQKHKQMAFISNKQGCVQNRRNQHQYTKKAPRYCLSTISRSLQKICRVYIYRHKNLPANLPDDIVKPKALTDYVTELQPAETVCAHCPGPVNLEKSARIFRKARILTMNGVMEEGDNSCQRYSSARLLPL